MRINKIFGDDLLSSKVDLDTVKMGHDGDPILRPVVPQLNTFPRAHPTSLVLRGIGSVQSLLM